MQLHTFRADRLGTKFNHLNVLFCSTQTGAVSGCDCPSPNPQNLSTSETGTLRQSACGPLDCFYLLYKPNNDAKLLLITVESLNLHNEADSLKISKGHFTETGNPSVIRT